MSRLACACAVGLTSLVIGGCDGLAPVAPTPSASAPAGTTWVAKPSGIQYQVDATTETVFSDPTWLSTSPGTTNGQTLYTAWAGDAVAVTPTAVGTGGCQAPAGGLPSRSPYELRDEGNMTVRSRAGTIVGVTFYIQDVSGSAGIMHSTDEAPVNQVEPLSGGGFILHVHRDHALVYRHKGHTGGPRVATVGCISVGDLEFTPR